MRFMTSRVGMIIALSNPKRGYYIVNFSGDEDAGLCISGLDNQRLRRVEVGLISKHSWLRIAPWKFPPHAVAILVKEMTRHDQLLPPGGEAFDRKVRALAEYGVTS